MFRLLNRNPVLLALVGLVAGCISRPAEPVVSLPMHQLAFGGPAFRTQGARQALPPSQENGLDDLGPKHGRPWKYIVIHHSATESGNLQSLDRMHRARGFDELGYHFVIGNGAEARDGEILVGSRWIKQKWGAHTGNTPNNEYNNYGIGICLVGNFMAHAPSAAQLAALRQLTARLVSEYDIPVENIIGHRDAPNAKTECPGDVLYQYVYSTLRPYLARQQLVSKR